MGFYPRYPDWTFNSEEPETIENKRKSRNPLEIKDCSFGAEGGI